MIDDAVHDGRPAPSDPGSSWLAFLASPAAPEHAMSSPRTRWLSDRRGRCAERGAVLSREWKDALWARFCTGAPQRQSLATFEVQALKTVERVLRLGLTKCSSLSVPGDREAQIGLYTMGAYLRQEHGIVHVRASPKAPAPLRAAAARSNRSRAEEMSPSASLWFPRCTNIATIGAGTVAAPA